MREYEIYSNDNLVGFLKALNNSYFSFLYDLAWLENGFCIDPNLPLTPYEQFSSELWGAFGDISPDRWGRIIQNRAAGRSLNELEYMLGVSDYFRIGSLRIAQNGIFLTENKNIPKLINISQLESSSLRLDSESYDDDDIRYLMGAGSSLGGARPKASVLDNNRLYIAKFISQKDEHSVILWEKTMLDLAAIAKINAAKSRLIYSGKNPILLVERFDRIYKDGEFVRVPFRSMMTHLNAKDGQGGYSYIDVARSLSVKEDKQELFARMLFNAIFANIDDHLRNHALLFQNGEWRLSPAFDINPATYSYAKQHHNLAFDDGVSVPNIKRIIGLKEHFGVDISLCKEILNGCLKAFESIDKVATQNGIKASEIKYIKANFGGEDLQNAIKELSGSIKHEIR